VHAAAEGFANGQTTSPNSRYYHRFGAKPARAQQHVQVGLYIGVMQCCCETLHLYVCSLHSYVAGHTQECRAHICRKDTPHAHACTAMGGDKEGSPWNFVQALGTQSHSADLQSSVRPSGMSFTELQTILAVDQKAAMQVLLFECPELAELPPSRLMLRLTELKVYFFFL